MRAQAIMAILCTMPLAAWSTQSVHVTLHSVPEGATLLENSRVLGVTPVPIDYTDDAIVAAFKAGQCVGVKPLTAIWPDGVQITEGGQLCPKYGYDQQATIVRPSGQAGATADAIVAAQAAVDAAAARLAATDAAAARLSQQAEADRIADNNAAMISNAINNASTNYNNALLQRQYTYPAPPPAPSAPVTCTTSMFFGQLKTVCH